MTRFLDWLGYQLLMYGHYRITCSADNPIGRWCLKHAGSYAHPTPRRLEAERRE